MKEKIIFRAVDETGHIVLPVDYRRKLDIQCGDLLSIEHVSATLMHIRKSSEGTIQVDSFGRIYLAGYAFKAGTSFEVILGDDCIALYTTIRTCAKCGGADTLTRVHSEILCASCARMIE